MAVSGKMNFWSPVRGNEAAFMHTHTFIIPVLTLNNVWILKKRYHVQAFFACKKVVGYEKNAVSILYKLAHLRMGAENFNL